MKVKQIYSPFVYLLLRHDDSVDSFISMEYRRGSRGNRVFFCCSSVINKQARASSADHRRGESRAVLLSNDPTYARCVVLLQFRHVAAWLSRLIRAIICRAAVIIHRLFVRWRKSRPLRLSASHLHVWTDVQEKKGRETGRVGGLLCPHLLLRFLCFIIIIGADRR